MRFARLVRIIIGVVAVVELSVQLTMAQNLSPDARRIALGGGGDTNNLASKMAGDAEPYISIPIPLGLFQVLNNRKFFDPNDPQFDPVRAVEYAADPLHLTLNRNSGGVGNRFVTDIVNAKISRDLNAYRGFAPAPKIEATGLASAAWGKTIHIKGDAAAGGSHGIFVGAGPYVSLGTNLSFDQGLIDLLASSTNVYRPNSTFVIGDTTTGQGAVAITGGYRGHFLGGVAEHRREGLYVATNYNYLHGIHYDTADLRLRFDTDSGGLVTLQPTTVPISVSRTKSETGNGLAMDVAAGVVTEHWDVSGGVDGIGNRITWKDLSSRQYVLRSLVNGADFVSTPGPAPAGSRRVTLPVRYSASGIYHEDKWSVATEAGRGFQGLNFGAGAEYSLGPIVLRGGSRYTRHLWHGASGIGFNLTRRFGIDVAAFQTSTNIEEDRRVAFAVSLRLTRPRS